MVEVVGHSLGHHVDEGSGDGTQPGMDYILWDAAWGTTWMHGDGVVDCRGSTGG